jgi:hypothetical protein
MEVNVIKNPRLGIFNISELEKPHILDAVAPNICGFNLDLRVLNVHEHRELLASLVLGIHTGAVV